MKRWERMEEFLYAADLSGMKMFTNANVAQTLDISNARASALIKSYQDAMTNPGCDTLYAIRREGRTAGAVWHVGNSAKDLRAFTGQFADDVEHRVVAVIAPVVEHITKLNPKAQPQATKTVLRIGRLIQSLTDLAK